MTTPDPEAIGPHRPDHRRGFLVFEWLGANWQNAEDATQENDYSNRSWRASVPRTRPSTPTEKVLLAHALGHQVPASLQTRVRWLSDGCRNRSWPTLGITEEGVVT